MRMKVKLTAEQQEQIQELVDEVWQAYYDDKPVMLAAQIGLTRSFDYMNVGIIPHEKAMKINKILGFNDWKEYADESS